MSELRASAERFIAVPAAQVYQCIADYHAHHPHFLPRVFSDLRVIQGGVGLGTVITFRMNAGGPTREFRAIIGEPDPGRVLTEEDRERSSITTFTVMPDARGCRVRIETHWQGDGGLAGLFERIVAPLYLKSLYSDELERLNHYALERSALLARLTTLLARGTRPRRVPSRSALIARLAGLLASWALAKGR